MSLRPRNRRRLLGSVLVALLPLGALAHSGLDDHLPQSHQNVAPLVIVSSTLNQLTP